jgi:hypothetical protein
MNGRRVLPWLKARSVNTAQHTQNVAWGHPQALPISQKYLPLHLAFRLGGV